MNRFLASLAGSKTYILAGGLILGVAVLVFLGWVTPAQAIFLIFTAGFASTFRHALATHQATALAVLVNVAAAGVAARQHDKAAELQAVEAIGAEVVTELPKIATSTLKGIALFVVLVGCARTLHAQTGCVESPELPTGILGLVGSVAFILCAWFGYRGRKKEKSC